jgi:hypothetical protein
MSVIVKMMEVLFLQHRRELYLIRQKAEKGDR